MTQTKELLQFELECEREKHKMRMEELQFFRDTKLIEHNKELERQRIKSAEIRKTQIRREMMQQEWKR